MTVTGTVTVGNSPSVTLASGSTVTANAGTGTFTVVQASGSTVTVGNSPTVTLASGSTVTANAGTGTFTVSVSNSPTVTLSGVSNVRTNEVSTDVVCSYGTATTVANSSTGTISYVVTTGKTFYFKGFIASSSGGPCKVIVDYGTTPTVITAGFYSTADPTWDFVFPQAVPIAASTTVRIKITNSSGLSQDVYGTIFGTEV